eukprot:XP_023975046.1 complexin-1 [Physeter catodon]
MEFVMKQALGVTGRLHQRCGSLGAASGGPSGSSYSLGPQTRRSPELPPHLHPSAAGASAPSVLLVGTDLGTTRRGWAPGKPAVCRCCGTDGATKDMGKMLGGDEEKDPDAAKKEEERQEALRQEEAERQAKHARMEAEREAMRQSLRDKYGIKKKEEREAEAQAAMEANSEGSLTRPKRAIPPGCGDEPEAEEESILDTVMKYLPGPLQDIFKK